MPVETSAPILRLVNVSKRFAGTLANDSISLDVRSGEVHCLLGENGAGKSTLIALLAGMYQPDSGHIEIAGHTVHLHSPASAISHGIGVVYQHSTLVPELTVLENVMLLGNADGSFWLRRRKAAARLDELSELLGASLRADGLVSELTLGEQQQLEVVKALWRDSKVLLLDEPTSLLTPKGIEELLRSVRRLAMQGIAVIFVSHKLEEVLRLADRFTVLRGGRVVVQATAQQLRELGTENDQTERGEAALRALLFDAMFAGDAQFAGDAHTYETLEGPQHTAAERPGNRIVMNLERVCTSPKAIGGTVLRDVSLELRAGEILGVAGIDGEGQQQLAEVLAGQLIPTQGTVRFEGTDVTALPVSPRWKLGIRYVSGQRLGEGIIGAFSVSLNLMLKRIGQAPYWRYGFVQRAKVEAESRQLIERYAIRTPSPQTRAATLSGGNIQKILLARELSHGARVVVFDTPSQGLDLKTVHHVHAEMRQLVHGGASVVLISTDLDELLKLADRIVVVSNGRVVGQVDARESRVRERIGELMVSSESRT